MEEYYFGGAAKNGPASVFPEPRPGSAVQLGFRMLGEGKVQGEEKSQRSTGFRGIAQPRGPQSCALGRCVRLRWVPSYFSGLGRGRASALRSLDPGLLRSSGFGCWLGCGGIGKVLNAVGVVLQQGEVGRAGAVVAILGI